MKRKTLLLFVATAFISSLAWAQKNKQTTAFAITGIQKGHSGWTEVRLVDLTTGEEVKSIYQSIQVPEILNARTGKPVIIKKDINPAQSEPRTQTVQITRRDPDNNFIIVEKKEIKISPTKVQMDKPFSTNSAALAYDKKHERLYYTPMGISQLRYIDLKTSKIYYFEDEPFGVLSGPRDVQNQITRMVIAADGNGYALTNNGNHLIRFTTGKNAVITDLGALNDDAAKNTGYSVHSSGGYGGDLIADAQNNLYLITANRNVFKISIDTKLASYMGSITGLPKGFTTNGAMVESGSMVIVCSSQSTTGYYRFDLNNLQAEKVTSSPQVFNASDLANSNLAFDKEKKKKDKKEKDKDIIRQDVVVAETTEPEPTLAEEGRQPRETEMITKNSIAVFPNPVTNGLVRLSFDNQPAGKYQVQFMDMSGKVISTQEVSVNNKVQVEEFRLPQIMTSGNYLVKITNTSTKASVTNKLVVYK